ncbi:pseudouridine synthase [Myroides marinus]|uniref:Pseudouridine synthase n=1 Tax=Myroides marinus TaxID=703342 RepID=A0A1H6XN00_9FLAO|nr:pseudouridine synthase [Myroides marinus]MDM1348760.1 pseudouridine synthase [Myroides marinus]MDM1352376.1 pseudouridine synthase [Myroides marinus]MDM1355774.1 pseudouridine synthase [Myroides marinus]MDM1359582.1 pseudouridine synthase [Myroides marinus]MDM1363043.1 pseudouridine synthase [Myroides marinus]
MESTHRHFLLYKPHGYISQFIYEKKRTKHKLGELYDFPEGTMAIGRLDENSEGLLFLTTDGMMSERVRGAHYEKEYYAQVDGDITEEAVEQMRNGVLIGVKGEKYMTKPCVADKLDQLPDWVGEGRRIRDERHGPTSWVRIVLTEGKFRQVRKMTAHVGYATLRLVRVRIGEVSLEGLKVGEVKEVDTL